MAQPHPWAVFSASRGGRPLLPASAAATTAGVHRSTAVQPLDRGNSTRMISSTPTSPYLPFNDTHRSGMTLFCLHHAGSNAASFRSWQAYFAGYGIHIAPLELPGHGTRRSQSLHTSHLTLIEDMSHALLGLLPERYAIYGHSLGALLGFELASALQAQGRPPQALFVSGRRPPQLPTPMPWRHQMGDAELVEQLLALGGNGTTLLAHPELQALFLPVIRADFAITECYQYQPRPALQCPLHSFVGERDPEVSAAQMALWQMHTAADFSQQVIAGAHFPDEQAQQGLWQQIARRAVQGREKV
ncbi:putative thioesterase [Herbaspirillum rubrisubalbicans]|uniref:Thioesterase n=2 Tax=Oxalobacteraceae TaxID=75682 RepID=A0AAD0XHF3_9BURK|nr:putative thioesterase [Herbaspirillum rubrisubalbicans]